MSSFSLPVITSTGPLDGFERNGGGAASRAEAGAAVPHAERGDARVFQRLLHGQSAAARLPHRHDVPRVEFVVEPASAVRILLKGPVDPLLQDRHRHPPWRIRRIRRGRRRGRRSRPSLAAGRILLRSDFEFLVRQWAARDHQVAVRCDFGEYCRNRLPAYMHEPLPHVTMGSFLAPSAARSAGSYATCSVNPGSCDMIAL